MTEGPASDNAELIAYRLDSMQKTLDKISSQQDKAEAIRAEQKETLRTIQADQQEIKETLKDHEARIRAAETAPTKDKAQKWEYITKILLELIVGACLAVILVKIGLK